jgi:hypothetical protein
MIANISVAQAGAKYLFSLFEISFILFYLIFFKYEIANKVSYDDE